MPPTDASTNAGTVPVSDIGIATSPGTRESSIDTGAGKDADSEDTLDLRLPDEFVALFGDGPDSVGERSLGGLSTVAPSSVLSIADDLLDCVADWGPIRTPAGALHLAPVRVGRDLPIISQWMNDPAVAAFWELGGPQAAAEEHLWSQLSGDGRSVPCLGMLEGTPMSYWEIYRADLDPLARHYPARPHDTGLHLLIGAVGDRGRGLGGTLLRAVADLVLDRRPACARVVAEPDIRNTPSIAAFLSAGFRFSAEVDLPAKRAALMVRDRSLRYLV
ncbi:N-acetyltransferase [Streptomyces cyaneochromogenes]|uniref:Lysine N-acyltransferase MbtK n=1 Tax=Streptomyces cyaneochromogenes TaxID=2496836 RepID=A0A3Q9EXD8_9ACTN|nr:GNAT family N-acetyltransferase [Streptomyces cyaneochromogenes]AZQ37889.1 N-acetyltransferase [Streptomyces cyaneochromogenes]